jgi:hypothetical protein
VKIHEELSEGRVCVSDQADQVGVDGKVVTRGVCAVPNIVRPN